MEQLTLDQYMQDVTFDRNGKKYPRPDWVDKERCETCKRWQRLPKEEQPPAGWGVKGQCNFIHDPKQQGYETTGKYSWCQDYLPKL